MYVPCRRLPGAPLAVVVLLLVSVGLAPSATAQSTGMVPYYGKNNIHYDTFQWYIYTTEHFEFYYYPDVEPHLERIAGYAESAYQQVSADLRHDLPFRVPMVLFKTHSEFEQQNIAGPDASSEGVLAFAEPSQHRMVLPIDSPPDELYGLIVHELTHQFEYDIVPVSLIRNSVPLWFYEGLSDYERGLWEPIDLMMIRDAAIADIVPKMSKMEGYGDSGNNVRLVYNLGHAVFEFIEARFGKEGLRNYLFSLRKSVIGGGEDAYEEALQMSADEFDQAFDRYLKDRFRPFRDKERPADYGVDLSPNKEKTKFAEALSIAPSPSGDLLGAVTINRKDQEIDIVLLSAKDGSIVRNLTNGFDKDMGFDHIVQIGRFEMPWMGWSPKGDRLAYFVRTAKERTLIVQNVLTGKIEYKIPIKTVDEPESPSFAPDGETVAFAGLTGGIGDIFSVDLATGRVTNLTDDAFAEAGPTYAPDGSYLLYSSRISGNQKLFRLDLDTKKKTQITFGTHDDTAAEFIDDHTVVFSSTATDPAVPIDPAVAANGRIYNVWTLDLGTGELRQYTDALGGNWSPVVLNQGTTKKLAFVSYYKNEYSIRTIERGEPLHTAASSDFGEPGPVIDFQAPIAHTLIPANQRKKRKFEKMFLEGRPPVNVGVTSNGDVFGGTQITLGDVLGDQQFNFYVSSIAQYRTMALTYVNLSRRFQWAAQGFSETQFFYGQLGGVFYDPSLAPLISRDQAIATRTIRGGNLIGVYPLDRYRRLELSGGVLNLNEQYSDPALAALSNQQIFRNGTLMPLGAAFVQETTVFREFGPLAGNTMRLAYDYSPKIAGTLSRQTVDADLRHYLRIGTTGVLATRLRGFRSSGDYPDFQYFGGNSEMHGYDYLSFVGQNIVFGNAELRFPIIEAALTPIGVVGGVRGMFFANLGAGWFDDTQFKFWNNNTETAQKFTGYETDPNTGFIVIDPQTGLPIANYEPVTVSGFRLQDARASYGIGLETFALGFPIHFDWSWRTLFNKGWEDVVYADQGGSATFRKPRFAVWIGYDF